MNEVYREVVLDNYRNPRNKGKLSNPTFSARDSNPLCGDSIEMQLLVQDGAITDVRFDGIGCAISQASASLLTEYLKGKKIDDVKNLGKESVFELLGNIQLSASRVKCALLSLKVAKLAAYGIGGKLSEAEEKELG